MKKKIVTLSLVAALAVTAIGGTLAYFTDKDSATNVMTFGNVNIEQLEKDKKGNDFEQNQPLNPMVDNKGTEDTVVDGFFNEKMENVIDKVVTVENTGSKEAFVRTILLFETAKVYDAGSSTNPKDAHYEYIGVLGDFKYTGETVTVNGVEYAIALKVYDAALAAGAESDPSLKQFFLAPTANNEVNDLFGDEYTILALSQAVQTDGFDNAETALNTAFGKVTAVNCAEWFK